KYLPRMALGDILGCLGLTEPDAGSNPAAMRTRARKDGDSYVLNGEKMWITSGSIADIAIIWAKVENEGNLIRGSSWKPTARDSRRLTFMASFLCGPRLLQVFLYR